MDWWQNGLIKQLQRDSRSHWLGWLGLSLLVLTALVDLNTDPSLEFDVFYVVAIVLATYSWGGRGFLLVSTLVFSFNAYHEYQIHLDRYANITELFDLLEHLGVYLVVGATVLWLRYEQSLVRQVAGTDALTGLANRRAFEQKLVAEAARSVRDSSPITLLMLDLDNFKQVNDLRGHQEGDRLITHIGQALHQRLRASDTVARYGGDEFVILLPNTSTAHGYKVAQDLRALVEREASNYLGSMISRSVPSA